MVKKKIQKQKKMLRNLLYQLQRQNQLAVQKYHKHHKEIDQQQADLAQQVKVKPIRMLDQQVVKKIVS